MYHGCTPRGLAGPAEKKHFCFGGIRKELWGFGVGDAAVLLLCTYKGDNFKCCGERERGGLTNEFVVEFSDGPTT